MHDLLSLCHGVLSPLYGSQETAAKRAANPGPRRSVNGAQSGEVRAGQAKPAFFAWRTFCGCQSYCDERLGCFARSGHGIGKERAVATEPAIKANLRLIALWREGRLRHYLSLRGS